ncbi:uncharacterized protein LOC131687696 [Topomyia yanbarensis]|uniref:uncharacterized protein LOC131687696 n=1 Tax=Topomyia yanbarensis TaxID=2498891 RepID=UPI00273A9AB1|nr:uncharacterized protein LOC131687696 [Topomyia yanbarensis]
MEKKKTNKRQFACLVAFMEKNPEIARGSKFVHSRESVTSLWWTLTDSLNSLDPPTRSVAAWQKVWTDKKLQLKRKLQHNKNEAVATGGGPNTLHSFNDVEETIIRLLSLDRAVNHNGSVFGVQVPSAPASGECQVFVPCDEVPSEEPNVSEDDSVQDNAAHEGSLQDNAAHKGQPAARGRGRSNNRNYRKALLEKQTNDLNKMKRHVSDCARYSRKSYDLQQQRFDLEKKRFKLEEEKFHFKKQLLLEKQKYKSQQLQCQLQLLAYKKQKLDHEMGWTTTADAQDGHNEMDSDD